MVMDRLKNRVRRYFTDVYHERSAQQLESEKWLVPTLVPFNRWFLMPAAVLIQVKNELIYDFMDIVILMNEIKVISKL